tara:strand:- start:110 stop:595 length:486 start_codon:yes stop_codon:yes gene_type:complete
MIHETDRAYIAGLFDGEGSIHFKRSIEKKKRHKGKPGYRTTNAMRINMEITMTDQSVLIWVHEVLGVGTLTHKPIKGKRKDGTPYLKQYRWRCVFRDAYYVCCLIWPWAHTKLPKIQQIIDHYDKDMVGPNHKDCYPIKKNAEIINLKLYKETKNVGQDSI